MKIFSCPAFLLGAAAAALVSPVAVDAQDVVTTVSTGTGSGASAIATNPVTNKIYVANALTNTVTVIDGAANTNTTVNVGVLPVAIAVNPVTNEIYVANEGSRALSIPGSVSVINGATNAVASVASTGFPVALAVNSVTNKIYVAAFGISPSQGTVTVIDGADNNTVAATVTQVSNPFSVAVNPVTNKVYVANSAETPTGNSAYVTIIDGADAYAATTLNVGTPSTFLTLGAIAVDPVTNQIYTAGQPADQFSGYIFQIDGASATVTNPGGVSVGSGPYAIAVNPVTNTVYLADGNGEVYSPTPTNYQIYYVDVFGGSNLAVVAQLQVGSTTAQNVSTGTTLPYALAVNPATNQIYVGNYSGGPMTVINGADNSFATLTTGGNGSQAAVTVNPVTNRIYVANYGGNVSVIDGTVAATANLPTGDFPVSMAFNPVTNKIYVVNFQNNNGTDGTVTVINAATHAVETTVTAGIGIGAAAVAVNPVTNQIYVVNGGETPFDGSVSVIDGASDAVTTTVQVGVDPVAVVVNPVTNKIFVTNYGYGSVSGSVSVIDGATNTVSATLGTRPYAIAVNTATNRLYLSNYHNVIVADGTTGATLTTITTISAGNIAVNPVTNKIYVVNNQDQPGASGGGLDTCTVIDGATNAVLATPGTQGDPAAIAINPATNMVYVVDQGFGPPGYVTVINGATNASVGFVETPILPTTIAVNPVTNKIYVGDFGSGGLDTSTAASGTTVTVIDANNGNSTTNITTGDGPGTIIVNPVTDETYVLNQGASLTSGGNVTVIGDRQIVPLNTTVTPLSGNQSASTTPALTFTAQSLFSPIAPTPQNVFYQMDSLTGQWTLASNGGSSFSSTVASLAPGLHTLYAYADDGQTGTSPQLDSPLIGAVSVYDFVVTSPATQLTLSVPTVVTAGTSFGASVIALDAFGNPAIGYAGTVAITSSDSAAILPAPAVAGTFPVTLYGTPGASSTSETITATDTTNAALTATAGATVDKTFSFVTLQVPNSPTYDGTPHGATATTSPFGLPVNFTYTGISPSTPPTSTPPTAAGYYEVVGTIGAPSNSTYYGTSNPYYYFIEQAVPLTSWATPAAVPDGTALSSTQLDATSTVPGAPFVYNPAAGTVLPYGPNQSLSATFTPTDTVDYASVTIYTTLTVDPPPAYAPLITTPPASQVVTPGGSVAFTITATGFPVPAYQWYFNNAPITGATGSTLNIPAADAGAAGDYSVSVTNTQGSVTSNVAALAVVVGTFSGDPALSQPDYLATDGVNLLVGGANSNASDPNSNAASHESIFSVPLPLGSAAATSLYPAFNPNELVALNGTIFWIDPTSGPQSGTQILSAADGGGGAVNPIYTGTGVNDPIVAGSGFATDGNLLYAADEVNGSIWSLGTDGSGLTQIGPNRYASPSTSELNTIAVSGGTLYIADAGGAGGPPSILSISTTGTSFTTVVSGAPLVSPSGIAVGDGMIYAADPGAGNTVWQMPVAGGAPVALLSGSVGTTPIVHLAGLLYAKGKLYVTDSGGGAIYEIQVATQAAPRISSPLTATASLQSNFSYQVQASGALSPYTYAAAGLPSGLNIDPNTGQITGTPAESGSFPVALTITDSTNPTPQTVQGTLQLTVYAMSITSSLDLAESANDYFYYYIDATGGSGSYTFAAAGLPAGLTLDPVGGVISGGISQPGTYNVVLTVTDSADSANMAQSTVQIAVSALEISSSQPTAIVNTAFSSSITAYGGTAPYTYSAEGLPAGLSIDSTTGAITGTPTQTGTTNVTVTVTDSADPANSAEEQLPISVEAFGLPSPLFATGTVGTPFSFQPTISGGQTPYTFSSSTLPPGLTLNPSTGAITGTPTQSVSYGVNFYVSDSSVPANMAYTYLVLTINAAPVPTVPSITSNLSEGATFGSAFSYTITGSDTPASFSASGLPGGLSLNASTGVISGTPTEAGTFDVTIGAANTIGAGTATLVINVAPGFQVPAISSSAQASGQAGAAFSYTILANNAPTAFSATGLPTGLALDATTGVISGTPAAAGTFSVSLTASNAAGTGQAFALDLIIAAAADTPSITSSATANGTVGPGFAYAITTSVAAASFAATALPAGLALNTTTGVISGTPTVSGTTTVTITAANATGTGAPLSLIIVIAPSAQAPVITSSLTAGGTQGQAFAYATTATDTPTSFTATGLPSGLAIDASTGAISGTPANVGASSVVLTASNASGASAPVILTITVNPVATAPAIISGNTAGGAVGSAFSYQIAANPAADSYAMTGGPAWLGIDTATGVLSGTPSGAPGTYVVVLSATNASGASAPLALTITLAAAAGTPVVTSTDSPPAVTAQEAYTDTAGGCLYQIQVLPGTQIQYFYVGGSLPAGLNLDPVHGLIFGTPTVPGTYTIPVGAANLVGIGAAAAITLTINAAPGTPTISNTGGSNASALDRGEISADGAPTASGSVGTAFSFQISATGNPTSYAASNLPAGLAVNPSTGLITGLPTAAGTFTALISASNGNGVGASTDLTITISPPASAPIVSSSPTDAATSGTTHTYQMAASNTPTSYNASGLPTGLALDSTSGLISGTPTAPGVYSVSLSANNASGTGPVETLTLTVASAAGAPAIASASTAAGTVGSAFTTYQVSASNGPISAYTGSDLPPGLSLDPVGGSITGTPTAAGTYTATLTATNATGPSSPFALSIAVAPASTSSSVTSTTTAGATAGNAFSYQITATNSPISYNVTGLPSGLAVNTTTGVISGTASVAGTYPVQISVNNAIGTGSIFTLSISVINPSSYAYLSNLSARAYVNTGANILIAGFTVGGSGSKQLLVRADGPSLSQSVSDYLAEPQISLYDSGNGPGESGARVVASDAGWGNNPVPGTSTLTTEINPSTADLMSTLGASPVWAADSFDSALTATLPVNSFTFLVSGQGSTPTGVAVAEIYDADTGIPAARLTNISARAQVGTGNNILIAGFVIVASPNTTETVLIRGVGTGLLNVDSTLTGLLAAPTIALYDSQSKEIASNTGWGNASTLGNSSVEAIVQPATSTIMTQVGAFPLMASDCAMVVALPASAYTMLLSGVNATTGIGLVEVYEVP